MRRRHRTAHVDTILDRLDAFSRGSMRPDICGLAVDESAFVDVQEEQAMKMGGA
jgi:hypothetical protein